MSLCQGAGEARGKAKGKNATALVNRSKVAPNWPWMNLLGPLTPSFPICRTDFLLTMLGQRQRGSSPFSSHKMDPIRNGVVGIQQTQSRKCPLQMDSHTTHFYPSLDGQGIPLFPCKKRQENFLHLDCILIITNLYSCPM